MRAGIDAGIAANALLGIDLKGVVVKPGGVSGYDGRVAHCVLASGGLRLDDAMRDRHHQQTLIAEHTLPIIDDGCG